MVLTTMECPLPAVVPREPQRELWSVIPVSAFNPQALCAGLVDDSPFVRLQWQHARRGKATWCFANSCLPHRRDSTSGRSNKAEPQAHGNNIRFGSTRRAGLARSAEPHFLPHRALTLPMWSAQSVLTSELKPTSRSGSPTPPSSRYGRRSGRCGCSLSCSGRRAVAGRNLARLSQSQGRRLRQLSL